MTGNQNPPGAEELGSFSAIVSSWNEQVPCESPTALGRPCRRTAHYRLNLHGCEQANLCGTHLKGWVTKAHASQAAAVARCVHCGQLFEAVEDSYTAVEL